MGCTASTYRIFLVCCNVALLFVGLSVFVLGLKMKFALTVLMLINLPFITKAVNAVVATGFFIALTGTTGICGACYESLLLLILHLFGLGAIVIMEFSLGVTLMIVKKTIESAIESVNCNSVCESALNSLVLDYGLPSAGLMMTIILVEALMIYSSVRLYFHIRDRPKISPATGTSIVIQNVQMQNVAGSQQPYHPPLQQIHDPYVQFMAYPKQPMSIEQPPVEQMVNPPDYASLSQQQPQQQPQPQQESQPPQYNELPSSSTGTQPATVVENSSGASQERA